MTITYIYFERKINILNDSDARDIIKTIIEKALA